MQFSVFGPIDTTFGFYPGAGQIIKLLPDGSRDTIANGMIGLNPSFKFDAAGNIYATDLFGFVYKFDLLSSTSEHPATTVSARAFPNPFVNKVQIEYELRETTEVSVGIYDLHGKQVARFEQGKQGTGIHAIAWDGSAAVGGVYFYRLQAGNQMRSGVLQLTK